MSSQQNNAEEKLKSLALKMRSEQSQKGVSSLAVVLGAGVSVDSGVPLTRSWIPLLWRWFAGMNVEPEHVDAIMQKQPTVRCFEDYGSDFATAAESVCEAIDKYDRKWLDHHPSFANEEYMAIMDQLEPRRQQEALKQILLVCSTTISSTYLRIANLVREGFVDTILTTNFDGIVARAIHKLGIHPLECSFDDESRLCSPSSTTPLIVYLHGNLQKYNMRNTPSAIRNYGRELKELIRRVLRDRSLLVCGYSGWDDGLMIELRDWFCNEKIAPPPYFCYWTFYKSPTDPLPLPESEYVHLLENVPAKNVFEQLSTYLGLDDHQLKQTLEAKHSEDLNDLTKKIGVELAQEPVLKTDPNRAIPQLLSAASGDNRDIRSHLDHPLRLIDDWCKCGYFERHHAVERRRILLTHLEEWMGEWRDMNVVANAVPSVMYPGFEGAHMNPGKDRTFTFVKGPLETSQICELADLWPRIRNMLENLGSQRWACYQALMHPWVYPDAMNPNRILDSVRDRIQSQARVMLCDLAKMAEGQLGILSNIRDHSRVISAAIDIDIEREFEILYPKEPRSSVDWKKREHRYHEDARKLADKWALLPPADICQRISTYETQAAEAGIRWPTYTRAVCHFVAKKVKAPVAWAIELMDRECSFDLVEGFTSIAITKECPGTDDLIIRCTGSDRYRAAGVLPILCAENPPESFLLVALSHTKNIESVIQQAVILDRVNGSALKGLLEHPFDSVAGGCAIAAWGADPEGEVPHELEEVWRKAFLRCVDDEYYQLARILDTDADLAFEWMMRNLFQIESYDLDNQILACASRLSVTRRQALLDRIPAEWSFCKTASALIGQDEELYSRLLENQELKLFHLQPIDGKVIPRFVELAHKAGYSERELAGAVYTEKSFAFHGPESLMWKGRIEYLSSFLENDIPIVKRVAKLAVEATTLEMKRTEKRERDQEI